MACLTDLKRRIFFSRTGDVRSGSTKQLVSAAGEGAAAALAIREHLRGHDAPSMEEALVGSAT